MRLLACAVGEGGSAYERVPGALVVERKAISARNWRLGPSATGSHNGKYNKRGRGACPRTSGPDVIAPPPPAVRAGGAGGLVLPGETAAHASETLAYSGICVRDVITRLGRPPSKASSPLAHQFCVFLSSSSARCCPAVPEPLLGRPRQLATTCSLPAAVCCRSRPLVQLASPTNPRVRPHGVCSPIGVAS